MRLEDGNDSNLPRRHFHFDHETNRWLVWPRVSAACETTTITPTATMKPALADRLAVLNTDEPMPPAEGPEDVAPGPARDPHSQPRPRPISAFALFGGVNDALTIAAIF